MQFVALREAFSGSPLLARLFFVVVNRNLLQIFGFENLAAVLTSHVIDPIPTHDEFRALVFAARHTVQIIPILCMTVSLSSPPLVPLVPDPYVRLSLS